MIAAWRTPPPSPRPDFLSGTLVVNTPPPQPHRAPAAPMYSPSDVDFGYPPRKPKRER